MARPLDHDLHAALPGAVDERAERDELRELCAIGRVRRAAWPHAVAEADGHVVLFADVEDVVVVLVERVLLLVVQHPARDERAAAAHDVHDAALFAHRLDGRARHTAVKRHEVRAVLRLRLDGFEDVVIRHLDDRAVRADGAHRRLIERHRADHDGRVRDDLAPRLVDAVARRKVHDRIRAAAHRLVKLLELRRDVGERARRADVRIDLRLEPKAHAARLEVPFCEVVHVRADRDRAARHALAHRRDIDMLLLCDAAHLVRRLPLARQLHLCCHEKSLLNLSAKTKNAKPQPCHV